MNKAIEVFLAKLWKKFKQNNPKKATWILVIGLTVIGGITYADQFGLFDLPEWAATAITTITTVIIGLNGSSTFHILDEHEKTKADRDKNIVDDSNESF